jgi:hypothetical protein
MLTAQAVKLWVIGIWRGEVVDVRFLERFAHQKPHIYPFTTAKSNEPKLLFGWEGKEIFCFYFRAFLHADLKCLGEGLKRALRQWIVSKRHKRRFETIR